VINVFSEVAAGVQIVYKLTWAVGHGNGVVKVPENDELADNQLDANRFQTGGQNRFTQNPEISGVQSS